MSERAAELWRRGQELDGSAEELLAELRANNAERNWDTGTIHRRMIDEQVSESRSSDDD